MPLRQRFLPGGPHLSLHTFSRHRFLVLTGIKAFLRSICALMFADIIEATLAGTGKVGPMSSVPGFRHRVFGDVKLPLRETRVPIKGCWDHWYSHRREVPEEDRTMFAVTREEVEEFFTRLSGDRVEAVYVEAVEKPL